MRHSTLLGESIDENASIYLQYGTARSSGTMQLLKFPLKREC